MKLVFLGSGYMAQAIINGIILSNTFATEEIYCINPVDEAGCKEFCKKAGIQHGKPDDISTADFVVLAFKPQSFSEAAQMYKPLIKNATIVTIMAGISTASVEKAFGDIPVIRVMPNMPLAAGKGAAAYSLGKFAKSGEIAQKIFSGSGIAAQVDESLLSAVTALSGSGPAYFYLLAEALATAAQESGMDQETAVSFANQTLIGSAKLLEQSGESASEMRRRITSKKGTTEAAVNSFIENGFYDIVKQAFDAAKNRSDELGS